jgi:heterodisulfide reductase subunit B
LRHDPIEDDPKIMRKIRAAEKQAEAELKAEGILPTLGYCHLLWERTQRILKKKYGIKWKTPAEMNPEVCID